MQATNWIGLATVMIDQKTFGQTLGQRIQAHRKAAGLTQAEFGKLLDLSQQVIADYEAGNRHIRAYTLARMGGRFDRSVIIAAGVFASAHFIGKWHLVTLLTFFPSVAFGWAQSRTRSIVAATLYHGMCNMVGLSLHAAYLVS